MKASPAEMRRAIREILVSVGARPNIDDVPDQASLLGAGVLDSLAMVHLVGSLEQRFGIRVSDDELTPEHFDSVADIERFVASKQG
jgi:acyl carrier protein